MLGKEDPKITRGWQQKLQEGNLAQTLGRGRIENGAPGAFSGKRFWLPSLMT